MIHHRARSAGVLAIVQATRPLGTAPHYLALGLHVLKGRLGMDVLTFISTVIASTASLCGSCIWPFTIFLLILILKDPLLALLDHLRRVKLGDMLEVELARELKEEAQEAGLDLLPRRPEVESQAEELRRLATVNPRGAVLEAWLLVEDTLRSLAQTIDLPAEHVPSAGIVARLLDREVIAPQLASVIKELRHIRNLAVHDRAFGVREEVFILQYIDVTLRVLDSLESIGSDLRRPLDMTSD